MEHKCYFFYFRLILLLLKIASGNNTKIVKVKRILNNYYSEIHLVVQGSVQQNILYNNFNTLPSKVFVNGVEDISCNKKCKLSGDKNNITLRFENQIRDCIFMFRNLNNIIELDFSDFDFSEVTRMVEMFWGCSNLVKINFGKINTTSLSEILSLFVGCSKLTSVVLSNFNNSKVTDMMQMFSGCSSL